MPQPPLRGTFLCECYPDFYSGYDKTLLNIIDGEWYDILYNFSWENYRQIGAAYYDALRDFNLRESNVAKADKEMEGETKEEATQRLLFDRATMRNGQEENIKIIYQTDVVEFNPPRTQPLTISPGVVPCPSGKCA